MKRFHVTTSILYANAEPHVGHAFELVGADAVARAKRMLGYDVYFQTGTDEHGQKMLEYAQKAGVGPKEYADGVSPKHRALWDALDITYDRFIRTTDPDHRAAVQEFWRLVSAKGDIYKGRYEGWYSVGDEAFVLESQTTLGPDGNRTSTETGAALVWKTEESYFFRWSAYQGRVTDWLEANPRFIAPGFRANEMVGSFLRPGLQDISISRASLDWGIPVPGDDTHVVYVWFDALINYVTGAGFGSDDIRLTEWWPADLHIVGKDILKFHTLLWPAMCMAAGLEPPRRVFGHGFVSPKPAAPVDPLAAAAEKVELREGVRTEVKGTERTGDGGLILTVAVFDRDDRLGEVQVSGASPDAIARAAVAQFGDGVRKLDKMAKSVGNVTDPRDVVARYDGNPDVLRYFLLREIDFGGDGIYSDEAVQARHDADLADKLGNLLSRTLTMIEKYQNGRLNQPASYTEEDDAVRDTVAALFQHMEGSTERTLYEELIDDCRFNLLLERAWAGVQKLNLYITEQRPFTLAKDPAQSGRLGAILYVLGEGLRMIAVQISPFMPRTAANIWTQLGCPEPMADVPFDKLRRWGYLDDVTVTRGANLFPKAERPAA